ENLLVTDAIRRLVVERAAANVIKQKGLEQGMQTLRDDGWVKVREGTTTIEEVLRVTEEEENA
ncbi:MAG: type II/IV secretion system protein, partial [Lentisphaerae bacterium]|nr:type II/IV secretion system protein [Lentisphaerota bacterium]